MPGTGRERNIVYDAGDLLEVLLRSRREPGAGGHKHVPYAWKLEDMFLVTAGTVSSLRLRGHTRPCYNLIEIGPERVRIVRKYPFDVRSRSSSSRPRAARVPKADVFRRSAGDP